MELFSDRPQWSLLLRALPKSQITGVAIKQTSRLMPYPVTAVSSWNCKISIEILWSQRELLQHIEDGWRRFAFLTRACFPCTIHLIMQITEPVSEWSCWRMFIEIWPHSELTFRHRASSIQGQAFRYYPQNVFYIFNQQIYFIIWYLLDGASLI